MLQCVYAYSVVLFSLSLFSLFPTGGKNQSYVEEDPTPGVVSGYLHYKHKKTVVSTKDKFSRYYFSLKVQGSFKIFYYTEKRILVEDEDGNYTASPTGAARLIGYIDLLEVLEVKESTEIGAPENALDLVTPTRVFQLIAPNESQCLKWLDCLSDALELRPMTGKNEISGGQNYVSKADRIQTLKTHIHYEGSLSLKYPSVVGALSTWKAKYFVIAKGKGI